MRPSGVDGIHPFGDDAQHGSPWHADRDPSHLRLDGGHGGADYVGVGASFKAK